ncbi:RNA polymerase Rpb4 family protein [Methanobacterium sp.]|uniref:RNA polymerase Rpb4 family protein n=1 Tax=Methanobacterium sp. TaxID=2164 RepID=UPI00057E8C0C|nr:RNA polymerase Rpb4 family protein [Methanobacterium sp.]
MIGKKVLETEPIPLVKVKELLEDREKVHELNYEQNLALDHVTKFSKVSAENVEKMVTELEEIVKKSQAIKIADIMPEDMDDMRLIFAKERGPHKREELEEILKIVDKYREKDE